MMTAWKNAETKIPVPPPCRKIRSGRGGPRPTPDGQVLMVRIPMN
jgi:hypothetical protein